jgi:hypothetical protein
VIACYDLHRRLPTYDFFNWLAHVRVLGATEITFSISPKLLMRKKWPHEETHKRLANYLLPGPKLAGLPARMGDDGDREIGTHLMADLWRDVQASGKEMPRLRSIFPPKRARYTVTIRETFWQQQKNSGPVWRKFANVIGARIIEDTSRSPIDLYTRVALYAGAEMNFGVPNGPLSMLWWTRYPMTMMCDPEVTGPDWKRQETPVGSQVPWLLPNQRLVWETPTMDSLMAQVPT